MTRLRRLGPAVAGAALLGWAVAGAGAEAPLRAAAAVGPAVVVAATGLTLLATLAASWRWTVLASAAGRPVPYGAAVAAYYRSQLVNATVPGGVLGDVERGARRGGVAAGPGLRTVVAERLAGQAVQLALAGAVVLVLAPASLAPSARGARTCLLAALGVVATVLVRRAGRVLPPRAVAAVVLASLGVVACHVTTFVLVARAVGVAAPVAVVAPLALLALTAASLPLNVAGWGPREGATVWLLGTTGLGAGTGLAVAMAYGLVSLLALLPGLALLLRGRREGRHTGV